MFPQVSNQRQQTSQTTPVTFWIPSKPGTFSHLADALIQRQKEISQCNCMNQMWFHNRERYWSCSLDETDRDVFEISQDFEWGYSTQKESIYCLQLSGNLRFISAFTNLALEYLTLLFPHCEMERENEFVFLIGWLRVSD